MDGGGLDGPDGDLNQPMASDDNDAPASAVHTEERHLKEVREVRWGPGWPLKAVHTPLKLAANSLDLQLLAAPQIQEASWGQHPSD